MKIKDLIKKLKEYDSEKDIVIYSCDSDLIEYGPLGFYENEGQVELHIDEGIKLQFKMILKYTDFTDDEEKMKDFFYLSKERFLESYSYLTEEEYNLTLKKVNDLATS